MNPQLPAATSRPLPDTDQRNRSLEQLQGIVQCVNLLERDLTVFSGVEAAVFDVPPDCPVFLHGERIKLRLLQPKDRVSIAFVRRNKRLVAQMVDAEFGLLPLQARGC